MRKNTIFISAALTAFVLAMLAGVVSAYNGISGSKTQQSQASAQPVQLAVTPSSVSPQDAATIAATYLKHTDLYSVELADLTGTQTYKVTFSSGDVVYVSLAGQVLKTTPPPPPVTIYASSGGGGGHNNGGNAAPPPPPAPATGGNTSGGHHDDGGGGGGDD